MHPYIYPPWMQFSPRHSRTKEDIMGAYPPRKCGLSGLCHVLHVGNLALRVQCGVNYLRVK